MNKGKMMANLINMTPAEVKDGLDNKTITLVDVREPHEFAARHVPGSLNMPLSSFKPADLPDADGTAIVFMCAGGVRSAKAVALTQGEGLGWNQHLAGGIHAWVQAGGPTT